MEIPDQPLQAYQVNLMALEYDFEVIGGAFAFLLDGEENSQEGVSVDWENTALAEPNVELPYFWMLEQFNLGIMDRLLLLLALAPELHPASLDPCISGYEKGLKVTALGGKMGEDHAGFLPTMDTFLFLLGGYDMKMRTEVRLALFESSFLIRHQFVDLVRMKRHEPIGTSFLRPTEELINIVLMGHPGEPRFGADFPAEKIHTRRKWEELVLPVSTQTEVDEVLDWIRYESVVMDDLGLRDKVEPGFRCLFYGPPGTGKTFTTTLIGQATERPVFRVDLSQVVSKYIGETEKNLRKVFDKAEQRDWILFFDEADALFGKRTSISDSKDRFANQEVSYLLQRIENHNGVVILATNHRDNLDKAFTRRFQLVVHFPMPSPAERLRLWRNALPPQISISADVNLEDIANRFELSGGSIMNVIRFCALQAARRHATEVIGHDFMEGIKREYRKVGRILK